jgi:hypothetical protein
MKFINQRLFHTKGNPKGDYTLGHFSNEVGSFNSFLLEDTKQEKKIKGITRIPAGIYPLKLREENTPLTIKHREAYKNSPWFKANPGWYHIEITRVTDFSGIYFHSGNDDSDTLGCNLPCFAFDLTKQDKPGSHSLAATDAFYAIVYPLLKAGVEVLLEVKDEAK